MKTCNLMTKLSEEIKFSRRLFSTWLWIVLALAVVSISVTSGPNPVHGAELAQTVTVSGVFSIIWGTEPVYLLVDDQGQSFTLHLDPELTQPEGWPFEFDRQRVLVTGILDPDTNIIEVQSIELEEDEDTGDSPGNSHLLGAHRSGPQRWATILCRYADSTGVTPQPATFFEDLLDVLDDFWSEVSYDNINLSDSDSQVVGWVNMPQNRADYLDAPPGNALNHQEIAEDCTGAADALVNFPDFDGINLIFNDALDCCAYGGGVTLVRDGVVKNYDATWIGFPGWTSGPVLGHEMGHGLGLPHSCCGSRWDIMSTGGVVHTIAFHKDTLGWIPDARRYVASTAPDQSVFIERLAQPGASGFLVVQIPIGGSATNFYTLEARKIVGFEGFDQEIPDERAIPGEGIVIHRVDTILGGDNAKVVDVDAAPSTNPNGPGAIWLAGEVFEDTTNNISVRIAEETATGFQVIINPAPVPLAAVSIAAAAGGSIKPRQQKNASIGDTIRNGDFLIERTGGNSTLGDGNNEDTFWTLDFTKFPNLEDFNAAVDQRGLRSALLTLGLVPKNEQVSTDTLQVGDLPAIGAEEEDGGVRPFGFPPIQELPLNTPSIVEIELLSFYTPDEILGASDGQVPMRFGDDAIVVFAHLKLVPGCLPDEACPATAPGKASP